MIRKHITLILIVILCTIIIFAFLHLIKTQSYSESDAFEAIPSNASVIMQVNNPENLLETINGEIAFAADLKLFASYTQLKALAEYLDTASIFTSLPGPQLKKRSVLISLHAGFDEPNKWMVHIPIKSRNELKEINKVIDSFKSNSKSRKLSKAIITEINKNEQIPIDLNICINDGILSISNCDSLLELSVTSRITDESINHNEGFKRIRKTSLKSNSISVYINYNQLTNYINPLFNAPIFQRFASWSELDLDIRNEAIYLNGFTYSNKDSLFTDLFKGIDPIRNEITDVIPSSTKFMMSFSFHPKDQFLDNLHKISSSTKEKNRRKSFKTLNNLDFDKLLFSVLANEGALSYNAFEAGKYSKLLVFNTTGQAKTLSTLHSVIETTDDEPKVYWSQLDNETKIAIYKLTDSELFKDLWRPVFGEVPSQYFAFLHNYIVFADDTESIRSFIYANILNKTLSTHPYYNPFTENFSYQENFFLFADIPHIFNLAKGSLNKSIFNPTTEQTRALSNFYGVGIQLSTTGDLIYTSLHASYAPHRDKEPRTIWQSRLDSTIVGKPAIVDNHNTGEKEILVQDSQNNLYLINSVGRILWKRSLEGQILSEIHQIDYFKNNKLQYLFNTAERLYLLDRNGNHVARYPINFSSKATNGLAVFDYDNDKEYRIFIALNDRRVYLFDKTGNINAGWNKPETEGIVNQPIQHFHNQDRDYIVFSDEFRNYIHDRRGDTRITPDRVFVRNKSSQFFIESSPNSESNLVSTTKEGELVKVALPSGKTSLQKLFDCPDNHHFTLLNGNSSTPEYLFVTENNARIFDTTGKETMQIEFENPVHAYSDIYRFSASDIKFGVIEKKGGRILLVNKNGTIYQGFPLRGVSRFSIGFLKSSAYRFNLITGGDYNYLYNYRIE